ncbi:MAG: hypothetical protein WC314_11080 [Vulcanimicrobiota bacterium]
MLALGPNLYRLPECSRSPRPESPTVDPAPQRETVKLGERKASWITDAIAIAQFVGSGILYKDAADAAAEHQKEHPPLSDAPVVKLDDPFLILPGWTTRPEKFDNLVAHLLKNPDNGSRAVYLREEKAYSDKECTQLTEVGESDKVFVCVYDNVLSPPDKTAPQIADAVGLIKGVHGEKVDVLGYSMGGTAVRQMLNQDLQKVDQVAFLGTSHLGSRFAALANYVIHRDIKFAMKLAGVNAAHLPAMQWMMPLNPEKPESSPQLAALNANLDRQLENCTEAFNIGSDGFATITLPWGKAEGGDGLVHGTSSRLEGIPGVTLQGRGNKQHGNLPSDTDAFKELAGFYGWSPVSDSAPVPPVAASTFPATGEEAPS